MSNNNSAFEESSSRLKIGSTGSIFAIFAILFISISVLFYLFIDHNQNTKSERIVERAAFRAQVTELINKLEDEAEKSLKNSLLFNISNKETQRFQTIYSLKSANALVDELNSLTALYSEDTVLTNGLLVLNQLFVEYDDKISESINSDGKLADLLDENSEPAGQVIDEASVTLADSILDTDSVQGNFLITEAKKNPEVTDSRKLESFFELIQNQLKILDNHMTSLIGVEIQTIRKESPTGIYVMFSLVMLAMLAGLGFLMIRKLKSSVEQLSAILDNIAQGELPEKNVSESGEFSRIVEASNLLVNYLDDASQFAVKIGEGDFNYEFKPKSKQDALGNSLIDMRNRLQEVAREDKIRNWINEGQAKFGEILRQHNEDIEGLGTHVITNLVEYLDASQGALFVVKGEDNDKYLELLSAYAYNRKKYIQKRIEIGEGLAGQSYAEGKTIYLTDIKTDHYDIQTGLGESRPSSILIVPLKEEDRIEGIIEIATLKVFEKHQMEFVESIGESLASSLNAGKINQITKKLLEETQEKAEEMRAQEEELRQNMEELAATQEQMERRNKEMEEIQKLLSEEKYLLNALLNNTHDRIYFKDKESKFIRVSNSMIELFGKQDESELKGKSDFDFGFGEHAKVAFEDEQNIIRTGTSLVDVVEVEKWDDGHLTWVSTTKSALRDLAGKIIGTFGISRDVTKGKQVELEMKKRKDWFENFFKFHPVGFVILDQLGKVNFASKSILASLNRLEVANMTFEDIFAEKSFGEFLIDIDYENTKDKEIELTLELKVKPKKKLHLLVISGSNESEDGTSNIFLIQK